VPQIIRKPVEVQTVKLVPKTVYCCQSCAQKHAAAGRHHQPLQQLKEHHREMKKALGQCQPLKALHAPLKKLHEPLQKMHDFQPLKELKQHRQRKKDCPPPVMVSPAAPCNCH
jgi:hypothetical protein